MVAEPWSRLLQLLQVEFQSHSFCELNDVAVPLFLAAHSLFVCLIVSASLCIDASLSLAARSLILCLIVEQFCSQHTQDGCIQQYEAERQRMTNRDRGRDTHTKIRESENEIETH